MEDQTFTILPKVFVQILMGEEIGVSNITRRNTYTKIIIDHYYARVFISYFLTLIYA
jgi:hypothetical protein